ncbi:MAG: DUF805 domain-containing protein [Pseudomonadota bacterium]
MADLEADHGEWYYAVGREQRGPVSERDLQRLISSGEVGADSLVWREGMENWSAARAALPGALIPQSWVDALPRSGEYAGAATLNGARGAGGAQSYYHPFDLAESVKTVLFRYAQFQWRARRREFWWWVLFYFLVSLGLIIVDNMLFPPQIASLGVLSNLFGLAVLVPSIAVTSRRLHDIGRSGWWQLVGFIPVLGWAVMVWWLSRPSDPEDNQYGPA